MDKNIWTYKTNENKQKWCFLIHVSTNDEAISASLLRYDDTYWAIEIVTDLQFVSKWDATRQKFEWDQLASKGQHR